MPSPSDCSAQTHTHTHGQKNACCARLALLPTPPPRTLYAPLTAGFQFLPCCCSGCGCCTSDAALLQPRAPSTAAANNRHTQTDRQREREPGVNAACEQEKRGGGGGEVYMQARPWHRQNNMFVWIISELRRAATRTRRVLCMRKQLEQAEVG